MATKQKTFAQRAKDLIKKYKGASYDPIQKRELEQELGKLAKEQEAYKQANGLNGEPQQGINPDGSSQFGGTGSSILLERMNFEPLVSNPIKPLEVQQPSLSHWLYGLNQLSVAQPDSTTSNYVPYSTSIAPALISGATSMIGNLILGNQVGGRKVNYSTMKPTQIAPEQISLAGERNQIAQSAIDAERSAMRSARTAARTRGEYMSNVGSTVVGINKNVGDAYSKSYQTEQLTNAQARQQASQFNAQNRMAVDEYNTNIKNKAEQERLANLNEQAEYFGAALESIPSTLQNIDQLRSFDAGLAVNNQPNYKLVKTPTGRKAYEFWKRKYNVENKFIK